MGLLPKISFVKGQGGLGRTLPGEDYISAIQIVDTVKPSGFVSGSSYVQNVLSISEAEALGIVKDYSDETRATASITITASGATSATLSIAVGTVDLGTYTSVGLSAPNEAIAIAKSINDGNYSHSYSATSSASTVTIIAPKGLGTSLNGTALTLSGTLTYTSTNFAGGVASKLALYHYQISEYFRIQPSGNLYIQFLDSASTFDFITIQGIAVGKIRQLAILDTRTGISGSTIQAIQSAVNASEVVFGTSFSVLYSCDLNTMVLNDLPDLSQLECPKVSVIISESLSGEGANLRATSGKSIPTLGLALGTLSLAGVAESIAWVGKFNLSDGTEAEVIGFANGISDISTSIQTKEKLQGFRYIFLRKFIGLTGSFFTDSNCTIGSDSDYAYLENNRVIDKAIRLTRTALLPSLNGPVTLNSDGTISDITIASLTGDANINLEQMKRNGEISDYKTIIDPNQNVLATSNINVTINILPKGVARYITVTIGFKSKL